MGAVATDALETRWLELIIVVLERNPVLSFGLLLCGRLLLMGFATLHGHQFADGVALFIFAHFAPCVVESVMLTVAPHVTGKEKMT